MKKFSIPFTKDGRVLSLVKDEHLKNIHEVYMPLPHSIIESGRPYTDLEQDDYEANFEEYLKQATELGIDVSLVANKQIIDSDKLRSTSVKLCRFVRELNEKYKIRKIVLSNMFIIKQYGQHLMDAGIEIELSVINNITTVGAFEQMVSVMPMVSSVCLSDDMIHDLDSIKYLKKTYPDITLKIIPNHGCLINCIGNNQHHNYASCTYKKEDGSMSSMSYNAELQLANDVCAVCRSHIPNVGRKLNETSFIRPEDIGLYEDYIDLFKISGREHSAERIINVLEAYSNREYVGNIYDLLDLDAYSDKILNEQIPKEFGLKRANCNHKCYKCHYCENISDFVKSHTK